jgi:mannosylglucosylglycerate synthase
VAFLSFRFGPTDGVSVVARTWIDLLTAAGCDPVLITGSTPPPDWPEPHRRVPGLGLPGLDPDAGAVDATTMASTLRDALADVDVTVVENLLTIPIHLPASRAAAAALTGRPALLHHHDPPWQRERFAHVRELPATDPAWRHVAITEQLAAELHERCAIDAAVIRNGFAEPAPRSAGALAELRAATRRSLRVAPDEPLLLHPVRAIERKDVPTAIRIAEATGATYWLSGPPEEDYRPTLDRLLADARCPVVHRPWPDLDAMYAACDHVLFPSTWEGFGNPPVEASLRRRTVTVGDYPAATELRRCGFRWFTPDDVAAVSAVLADPAAADVRTLVDHNREVARRHCSLATAGAALVEVFHAAGWLT